MEEEKKEQANVKSSWKKVLKHKTSGVDDIWIYIDYAGMKACLSMKPSFKGRVFDVNEIHQMLADENIVHGIKKEKIFEIVTKINNTGEPVELEEIATGAPVFAGSDAQIRYHFNINKDLQLVEDEDGNIDYKELGLVNNINANDLLAEKIPLVEPVAGTDIYGDAIKPTPVKDINFAAGKNVKISEDGLKCYAEIDGQVQVQKKMMLVSPVYTVPRDVDLHTGNITFNGTIIVRENVLSGFVLKAKEDITVLGVVEGATLIAGGNIFIKKGIKGGDKCIIQCKGSLTTSFIENATIESHGDILVERSIINSDLTCFSKISCTRKNGHIVGGCARAIGGIECNELGSKIGVNTQCIIGDKFIIRQRIEEAKKFQENAEENLKKLNEAIFNMNKMFENLQNLPPEKREPALKILEQKKLIQEEISQNKMKLEKLMALFQVKTLSVLKVFKTCYPASSITIGTSTLTVNAALMHSSFSEDHASRKVRIGPA